MLKEDVHICIRNPKNDSLKIVNTVRLKTYLDEIGWEVYTKRARKWYILNQQSIYFNFIVDGEHIELDDEIIKRLT